MRALSRLAVVVSLLAAVTACAMDDPGNRFEEISYAELPAIGLDVGSIEIEQIYKATRQAPHVEHRFHVPPGDAARRWAEDRLAARGDRLTFRYIVREASALETKLETASGVKGLVTTDQAARYDVHIAIEMQVLDGHLLQGTAKAEARRSTTVPEGITLAERERTWYRLTEDTMKDLDRQLEETIRTAFFPYIVL